MTLFPVRVKIAGGKVRKGIIQMIRLIATDLDGTLLEPDGTLPKGIFETVEELSSLGIHFAASSGRQYGNLVRLFRPVAHKMAFVCEDGALSMVEGEVAGLVPLRQEDVGEILADIAAFHMNPLLSGKFTCYMFDTNRAYSDDIVYRLRNTVTMIHSLEEIDEPIIKVSGQLDEGVQEVAPILLQKWSHRLTATVSGRDWFDFTVADKGTGMQCLMKHLGLQKEEVAAFGDNFNDEAMLDCVGHPFIMQQAHPALHKPQYRECRKVLPVLQALVQTKGDLQKALALL